MTQQKEVKLLIVYRSIYIQYYTETKGTQVTNGYGASVLLFLCSIQYILIGRYRYDDGVTCGNQTQSNGYH